MTERLRGNYAFDLDSPCFPSSANQMEMTGETHHESIAPGMALQSAEMALSHIGLIAEGDERGADGEREESLKVGRRGVEGMGEMDDAGGVA